MGVFAEAESRLFKNMYVCRHCEKKTRTSVSKVLAGKAVCRTCSGKALRPVRKIAKK